MNSLIQVSVVARFNQIQHYVVELYCHQYGCISYRRGGSLTDFLSFVFVVFQFYLLVYTSTTDIQHCIHLRCRASILHLYISLNDYHNNLKPIQKKKDFFFLPCNENFYGPLMFSYIRKVILD